MGKLLDSCVVYVGRFTDQGSWIRRGTKESVINSGRESPALRGGECHKSITVGSTHMFIPLKDASRVDEKTDIVPLETPLKLGSIEVVGQVCILVSIFHLMIHNGICRSILLLRHRYCHNLRRVLMENDKIVSACNNIVYYIVNPALRGKTR